MPLSGHFVTARADERFSTLETDSANGVVQEVDLVAIRETLQLRHTPLLAPWGTVNEDDFGYWKRENWLQK